MPQNMKEEIIFTFMMIPTMVSFMVLYNTRLTLESISDINLLLVIKHISIMGIIAAIVEIPIIAPLAHKLAFKIIKPTKCKPILIPVTISFCTVSMMCPFMSLMANIFLLDHTENILKVWLNMASMNYPIALAWQLIVAGPLVRKTFIKIFR